MGGAFMGWIYIHVHARGKSAIKTSKGTFLYRNKRLCDEWGICVEKVS